MNINIRSKKNMKINIRSKKAVRMGWGFVFFSIVVLTIFVGLLSVAILEQLGIYFSKHNLVYTLENFEYITSTYSTFFILNVLYIGVVLKRLLGQLSVTKDFTSLCRINIACLLGSISITVMTFMSVYPLIQSICSPKESAFMLLVCLTLFVSAFAVKLKYFWGRYQLLDVVKVNTGPIMGVVKNAYINRNHLNVITNIISGYYLLIICMLLAVRTLLD